MLFLNIKIIILQRVPKEKKMIKLYSGKKTFRAGGVEVGKLLLICYSNIVNY